MDCTNEPKARAAKPPAKYILSYDKNGHFEKKGGI
jgi:hypothetical protein